MEIVFGLGLPQHGDIIPEISTNALAKGLPVHYNSIT
jgi:hypothetical protein